MRGRGGTRKPFAITTPLPGVARISHQGSTFFWLIIAGWKIHVGLNQRGRRAASPPGQRAGVRGGKKTVRGLGRAAAGFGRCPRTAQQPWMVQGKAAGPPASGPIHPAERCRAQSSPALHITAAGCFGAPRARRAPCACATAASAGGEGACGVREDVPCLGCQVPGDVGTRQTAWRGSRGESGDGGHGGGGRGNVGGGERASLGP